MRTFQLGAPPQPTGDLARDFAALHDFVARLVDELATRSQETDRPTKDAYVVANMGTPNRSIDFSASNATTVREVLTTLITDLKARGRVR